MKKAILPLLLCILLAFSACGYNEFDPDEYVGEGLLTAFGIIVDENQYFYNEVFVLGHLETDEKVTKQVDGKTYARVKDEKIGSYEELTDRLLSVYTEECVKSILENYDFYIDIDGALYYDLSNDENTRGGYKWIRNTEKTPELEGKTENSYTIEYKFDCGKKDELDEFTFVRVEGGYRLAKLQYVT